MRLRRAPGDDRVMPNAISLERLPERRRGAGHPTEWEALRVRVLSERARIGRLSRIRDHADVARVELEILLREEGLEPDDARVAAERIARSKLALIKTKVVRSGLQVLIVGGASAGIGFLIGSVGPRLFGA